MATLVVYAWAAVICPVTMTCRAGVRPRLVRYGFSSGAGYAQRGYHRAAGWSLGIPIAGLGHGAGEKDLLFAGLWYAQFYAVPPPAPGITLPLPILPSRTGLYTTVDYAVQIIGTKAPTVVYPYHAYALVATNGIRCDEAFVTQLPDHSQWSATVHLSEGEELELAVIASNVFGESASPTVLRISQIPESLAASGIAWGMLTLLCRWRRHDV